MRIAYDATLKRPGCVLLAAAMRCETFIPHHFPTESWLLAPTPDLKVYPVTIDQLKQLVEITRKEMERGSQT